MSPVECSICGKKHDDSRHGDPVVFIDPDLHSVEWVDNWLLDTIKDLGGKVDDLVGRDPIPEVIDDLINRVPDEYILILEPGFWGFYRVVN